MKKIREIYIIRVSALLLIFMLSGFILINICSAQKKEESKPEVKIDVNKKYDEKGNIILYDSSYTRSWQSNGNDIDSVLDRIHHHLEIYNFDDNSFFPHSQLFPEFPDFNLDPFFRYSDSLSKRHDHLDTVLKRSFHNDLLNWNFLPFDPCDSLDFWYKPYNWNFPHSYFDDLEKHLEEMRKLFERDYGSSPFDHDDFYPRDLKDKHKNKPKKNTISINT